MHKKPVPVFLVLLLTMVLALNLMGCSESSEINKTKTNQTQKSAAQEFTKAELSKYNGQNGNKSYVAVDGKVYDVSNDRKWHNGKHEDYQAGTDLTEDMKNSPHGSRVLNDLPVVGVLKE